MLIKASNKKLVSVILPVYNAEKHIIESVESILSQSYPDFELILINDGSTDNTSTLLKKYQYKTNVKIIERENKGIVATLNEGINICEGSYIMRMDADDICLPERMEIQLQYLTKNNLDIVGSSVKAFGNNKNFIKKYFEEDEKIKFQLLFATCFAHPTVFSRKEPLIKNPYSSVYEKIEDYELWTRLAKKNYKMGNLPDILLKYRVHKFQITNKSRNYQDKKRSEIAINYASHFFSSNQFFEAITILLNRNFEIINEQKSAKVFDYYQLLLREYAKYSDIIDYHFFLWHLYNFFPQNKLRLKEYNFSIFKRFVLLIFNRSYFLKKIPINIYRSLYS